MPQTCENCGAWHRAVNRPNWGECRRHAPESGDAARTARPAETPADFWCGDYVSTGKTFAEGTETPAAWRFNAEQLTHYGSDAFRLTLDVQFSSSLFRPPEADQVTVLMSREMALELTAQLADLLFPDDEPPVPLAAEDT